MRHWLINITSNKNAIVTSNTLKQSGSYVHSCQQESIGLKFSKSQTGSDVLAS